jgi:hypothetical protein
MPALPSAASRGLDRTPILIGALLVDPSFMVVNVMDASSSDAACLIRLQRVLAHQLPTNRFAVLTGL